MLATPSPVTATNGLAVVTVTGLFPGNGTFTAEVASSQSGRAYGPVEVPVHVYTPGRIPVGVTLSPKIDLVVTNPDGGEEEGE